MKTSITSKYGTISLKQSTKVGFDDIVTLHAQITPPDNKNMVGTDVCLQGCTDSDIETAKSLFLKFPGENILEETKYGQVIEKNGQIANIYINGVKVAEEQNFLFSYNVTSLTKQLKKALNRERTNVGRSAYTDRVKNILQICSSYKVIKELVDDLQQFSSGKRHDELNWNEIAMYASKKMCETDRNTTFVTSKDLEQEPDLIDEMKRGGFNPVIVPDNLAIKMNDYNEGAKEGTTLNTTQQYYADQEKTFEPKVIPVKQLNFAEKKVFERTNEILELIGGKPTVVKDILIAETLYNANYRPDVVGLWSQDKGRILIKRSQLKDFQSYAGTLLHECAHARSGASDVSRDFEIELTDIIGILAGNCLKSSDKEGQK